MACNCKKKSNEEYVWTSADGTKTLVYPTEIQAKARALRRGGTYAPRPKG